jgi:type II secretory pathway component PulF
VASFQYSAVNSSGTKQSGTIEASNRVEAIKKLKSSDLKPLEVVEEEQKSGIFKYLKMLNEIELTAETVDLKEKYLFSRQLASMLRSGIPIVSGLNALSKQLGNDALKSAVKDIAVDIEKGHSFSSGLQKHDQIFSEYFIKLVEIGEEGGFLAQTLTNLASYFKQKSEKKKKFISAISYPAITMSASIIVVILLMVKVLPNFMETFKKLNIELPLPTKIIMAISRFMTNYWLFLVLTVVAMVSGVYYYYNKTETGELVIDSLLLKVPLLNSFILENSLIIFSKNLSLLEESGVAFLQSMRIVNNNISNKEIKNRLNEARLRIRDGVSISDALQYQDIFPGIAIQMIKIGEETGDLNEKLDDIVDFYEEEAEERFDKLISLIEPVLIIFLTFVIGGIVAAVILPIFKMSQGMG